jgi:hypothetical protein
MLMAASAFAATANISGHLPANQQDTEVSTVAKASSSTTTFYVTINSLSNGYSTVCAWTERPSGINLSNPATQITKGPIRTLNYYDTYPAGLNVVLNLDNPISTSATPAFTGSWSPR